MDLQIVNVLSKKHAGSIRILLTTPAIQLSLGWTLELGPKKDKKKGTYEDQFIVDLKWIYPFIVDLPIENADFQKLLCTF